MSHIHTDDVAWEIDSRVRFRKILDEAVCIHQEKAEVMVLNEAAFHVLECCEQQLNFTGIVDRLFDQYEVGRDVLIKDISDCISDLEERGFIHPVT